MTRTSSLLLAFAAAALCFHTGSASAAPAAAIDTVADSCGVIRDFVDAGFCASRLRTVPGAASADRHAHLLAAADLAAASGAAARDAAAAAARDERNPAARSWAAARALLPLTGQAGIGCEAALGGAPATASAAAARMASSNGEFEQLTTMTTALLNSVATAAS